MSINTQKQNIMLLSDNANLHRAATILAQEFSSRINRVTTRIVDGHEAVVVEGYMTGNPIEFSWIKGFVRLYQDGTNLIIEF